MCVQEEETNKIYYYTRRYFTYKKKTTFILYYFFFTGSWLGASIKASKLYFKDYIYILIQYCTFIIYIQYIINT